MIYHIQMADLGAPVDSDLADHRAPIAIRGVYHGQNDFEADLTFAI